MNNHSLWVRFAVSPCPKADTHRIRHSPFCAVFVCLSRIWSSSLLRCSSFSRDWTPRHWNHDLAAHGLNEGYRLVHSISPTLNTPRLLSPQSSLLQVCELPEVVDCVEISYLHKPGTNSLHDFLSCFQSLSPVSLPFEEVTRVESVRS